MKGEMSIEMIVWIVLALAVLGLVIGVFFFHFDLSGKIGGAVNPLSNLGK